MIAAVLPDHFSSQLLSALQLALSKQVVMIAAVLPDHFSSQLPPFFPHLHFWAAAALSVLLLMPPVVAGMASFSADAHLQRVVSDRFLMMKKALPPLLQIEKAFHPPAASLIFHCSEVGEADPCSSYSAR